MNNLLPHLIEALREELKQYGEMLALLDQQQELVMHRHTDDLLLCVNSINAQADVIHAARREREQRQRQIARRLSLNEDAGFAAIVPLLPADYRPLVSALVQENNELLHRVQNRARQNHLLLNRVVELMQRFINTLIPGAPPTTYDHGGAVNSAALPQHSLFEAIG